MLTLYKILIGVILLIGLYLGAFLHGRHTADPLIIETTREVEKKVEVRGKTEIRTVYRDRIIEKVVTVEKAPDGKETRTEKVTTTDKDREKDRTAEKDTIRFYHKKQGGKQAPAQAVPDSKPQYSLGLRYRDTPEGGLAKPSASNTEITAGYRLVGDLWLDSAISRRDLAIGISYQFGGE